MATITELLALVPCLLLAALTASPMIRAGDSDILSDFIAPSNKSQVVDVNFFTYRGLRVVVNGPAPPAYKGTKASMVEFPALNGQSVSMVVLKCPPGGINPPHTRPSSTGLLFVVNGSLEVGLIDTTNKLYTQTLQTGDMFVFPKGLVHYQYNADPKQPTTAVASFGSASAGSVSVPSTVFLTGIDDKILAKSFKVVVSVIQKIRAGLVAST